LVLSRDRVDQAGRKQVLIKAAPALVSDPETNSEKDKRGQNATGSLRLPLTCAGPECRCQHSDPVKESVTIAKDYAAANKLTRKKKVAAIRRAEELRVN
jgi:hypothetical protein